MSRPTCPIPLWENGAPDYEIAYGQPEPTLTPFFADKGHGAVIVCPGGGYQTKAGHEGAPIARMLNAAGIHAFVLSYRVKPYVHPVPLRDALRAIRMVRFHAIPWGLEPSHIGILGFSAGGHLCASAGTNYDNGQADAPDPIERVSCRPDAIVPCYAVMSGIAHPHLDSFKNLTGQSCPSAMTARQLSPDMLVNEDTPPAFIWHTAEDAGVPVENSLMFAAAMSAHKRSFALHIFPQGRHGIGLGEDVPLANAWPRLLCDWLHTVGF